eukprot:366070-Chlamydomonas_euryale.AAC.16
MATLVRKLTAEVAGRHGIGSGPRAGGGNSFKSVTAARSCRHFPQQAQQAQQAARSNVLPGIDDARPATLR